MRKFKLIKGTQTYDLMAFNHFLNTPSGLGFDVEYNTLRSGEGFIITKEQQAQKYINGSIVFKSYVDYTGFINFIGDNKNIELAYSTDNSTWHYIPVAVASLGKGEKGTDGVLTCELTLIAFGLWYTPLSYAVNTEIHNVSNGAIASPMRIITTSAPLTQFTWEVWQSVNGTLTKLSGGKWNGTLASGQYLVIDSSPNKMEMAIYSDEGEYISNEYIHGDFTTQRFCYAPSGISTFISSSPCTLGVKKYEYSV